MPVNWDERTVLTTMLDYVRDTGLVNAPGSPTAPPPRAAAGSPLTTIASLVSHLRWVEYYWIRVILRRAGMRRSPRSMTPTARCAWRWASPSPGYWLSTRPAVTSSGSLWPQWTSILRHGHAVLAEKPVTLRWVLFHLIEETARHNGHIDILREMADGVTGR